MSFNHEDVNITAENGEKVEEVNDFKYLGSYMASTEKDVKVWKARTMHQTLTNNILLERKSKVQQNETKTNFISHSVQ